MGKVTTALIAGAVAALSPPVAAQTVAITGGHVITAGPDGDIEGGTVLIRDGRIVAVGRDIVVPEGMAVVDARGKVVAPGFVSPLSGAGLNDTVELNDMAPGGRLGAANDIALAFNPNALSVRRALLEGSTSAIIAPALPEGAIKGGTVFAGQAAAVELSGSFDFVIRRGIANGIDLNKAGEVGRAALLPLIGQQLAEARALGGGAKGKGGGGAGGSPSARALVPVVEGREVLLVEVERASDIVNALAFAREQNIRIALVGAAEAWLVAPQIAAAKVPVIVVGDLNFPETFNQLNATWQNAQRLAQAGVEIAILPQTNMPSVRNPGPVRYVAGRTVRFGLDHATAIRAITSTPARIFGIDDEVGSLAPGKRGDVVVWSGDPLEVSSFAEAVFVKGVAMPLTSRETLLRDKYAGAVQ